MMNVKGKISNNIINFRRSIRLNQIDLANLLRVNRTTVHNWEAGKRRVPIWHIKTLVKLAKKYNFNLNFEDLIDD